MDMIKISDTNWHDGALYESHYTVALAFATPLLNLVGRCGFLQSSIRRLYFYVLLQLFHMFGRGPLITETDHLATPML